MLGKAAVAMWWDVPQKARAEWEDWHTHEHMPERLSIPGFLRGTRWLASSGKPSYFVLYEVARLATLTHGAYLERLNHPTPWSRKMMPQHRNMTRSLCRIRASSGGALAEALATLRFSLPRPRARSIAGWLSRDVVPQWSQRKGLAGACLLESRPLPQAQTTEQKIRGGDARADWVLLAFGYDSRALARATAELRVALARRGALCDAVGALYRPALSLTFRDA